jgi:hypothetical protein
VRYDLDLDGTRSTALLLMLLTGTVYAQKTDVVRLANGDRCDQSFVMGEWRRREMFSKIRRISPAAGLARWTGVPKNFPTLAATARAMPPHTDASGRLSEDASA